MFLAYMKSHQRYFSLGLNERYSTSDKFILSRSCLLRNPLPQKSIENCWFTASCLFTTARSNCQQRPLSFKTKLTPREVKS